MKVLDSIENKKGAALVSVLILLAVFAILGTALISVSYSQKSQSINGEKRVQSEYLARSGLEIFSKYIIEETKDFENRFKDELKGDEGSEIFKEELTLETGKVEVRAVNTLEGIRLEATGIYKGVKNRMAIDLKNKNIVKNNLFIEGYIEVAEDSNYKEISMPSKTENLDMTGSTLTVTENDENVYSTLNLKELELDKEPLKKEQNGKEGIYYGGINIKTDKELRLETGGEDRILAVDSFKPEGHIYVDIEDEIGRVIFFLNKATTFKKPFLNAMDNLAIFSSADVTIDAGGDFNAYIYAPKSKVTIVNGTNFKGGVIAKQVVGKDRITHRYPSKLSGLRKYIDEDIKSEYEKGRYYRNFE